MFSSSQFKADDDDDDDVLLLSETIICNEFFRLDSIYIGVIQVDLETLFILFPKLNVKLFLYTYMYISVLNHIVK